MIKTASVVPLTQGQVAFVDAGYHGWLSERKWYAHWDPHTKSFYAARMLPSTPEHPKRRTILMHNAIWEHHNGPIPDGFTVDHVNRDTLDNRLSELRLASYSQQGQNRGLRSSNTSGYRGVSWDKHSGKWRARIRLDGKEIYLGLFADEKEAARAYDAAARIHHDPAFAQLNFPDETPRKN